MPHDDFALGPHVAFYLPHLGGGGTEKMVTTLANGLSARGYNVDMVLVRASGTYLQTLSRSIHVVDLEAKNSYLSLPGLMTYLRHRCPQILVSALSLTNLLALIARGLAGSPSRVAIRIENSVSAQWRAPWKKMLEKPLLAWVYPWADVIIAVSRAVATDAAEYLRIPLPRIEVIYNPAMTAPQEVAGASGRPHPWLAEGCAPVILGVGRLTRAKDFATLIQAFAEIRRRRPARLIILGEGDERAALESLAEELRVTEDVDLPGFVSDSKVFMKACKVFVLSSRYEGLPTVLIEALASGCSVISTDCPGGSREILAGGAYGELVPVADARAMAAAIDRALDGERHNVDSAWLDQFRLETVIDQNIKILGLPPRPGQE